MYCVLGIAPLLPISDLSAALEAAKSKKQSKQTPQDPKPVASEMKVDADIKVKAPAAGKGASKYIPVPGAVEVFVPIVNAAAVEKFLSEHGYKEITL